MAPEVTVIVPTRDRCTLLRGTLASVLAQEDVDLEVVVVNDGSTDGTQTMLDAHDDGRVHAIHLVSSGSVARARNTGMERARGRWLAFLDDDDLWAPSKLRAQLDAAASSEADFVYCAAVLIDRDHRVVGSEPAPPADGLLPRLFPGNPIPAGASSVLARASLVREAGGFDEQFTQLADWDMWIRLVLAGRPAACPEYLVGYLQHPTNMLISDTRNVLRELDRLARKHQAAATANGAAFDRSYFVRWAASGPSRAGDRLRATRIYLRGAVRLRDRELLSLGLHELLGRRVTRAIRVALTPVLGRPHGAPPAGLDQGLPVPASAVSWLGSAAQRAPE